MFKKILLLTLLSGFVLTSQATSKKEIAMLVVPRDAKTIQIAQDIAEHYPVLIVCYQQTHNLPKLHAWNGEGWVELSVEDYETGVFFENPPQHAIIIEPENTPSAELLVPDGLWCESGNRLTTTDPRTMIHLLGLYFDFQHRQWKQLAQAHGLSVADINPGLTNIYWWQYPEKRPTLDIEADMSHWLYLDITPPEPVEPVVIEEEPEPVAPVETPAEEEVVSELPEETTEIQEELPEIAPVEEKPETVVEAAEEAKPETEAPVVEAAIEEIIETLEAAPEVVVDPFSAEEIPAAKVVLPPTE